MLTCTPLGLTALERPRPRAGEAPRAAEGRASPSGVGAWDRRKVSVRGAELGRHCPAHEELMGVLGAPGCTRRPTPGAPWPGLTRRPGFSRPLQPGEKLWSEALPPSPPNGHAQRSLRCLSPPAPAPWPSRALVTLRCGPVSITPAWCSATSSLCSFRHYRDNSAHGAGSRLSLSQDQLFYKQSLVRLSGGEVAPHVPQSGGRFRYVPGAIASCLSKDPPGPSVGTDADGRVPEISWFLGLPTTGTAGEAAGALL